jgi:hypothetical protein
VINFCKEKSLFITNSAFKKPARNITMWVESSIDADGKTVKIPIKFKK